MKKDVFGPFSIYYEPEDSETAAVIRSACQRSIELIEKTWGLSMPPQIRLYVMTSWFQFMFHSAPWGRRIIYLLTVPLWAFRAKRTWAYAGGWAVGYRNRPAIGIKPPRLLEQADKTVGSMLFAHEDNLLRKIEHITCHELTHACAAQLRLPLWLNEGLAMRSVDHYFSLNTVKSETLELLADHPPEAKSASYQKASRMNRKELAYQTVRGYWITRYMEESYPELLRSLLSKRRSERQILQQIARILRISKKGVLAEIEKKALNNFQKKMISNL
jgi:hypothetical protein